MSMRIRVLFITVVALLLSVTKIRAQESQTITGNVSDKKGSYLAGAIVLEKNTKNTAITDADGNYTLEVSSLNTALQISYIGFVAVEVPVKGQNIVNIVLVQDVTKLNELVVVGYGTQKKANLTGSLETISSDEIAKQPVFNVTQVLQGQMPGVIVQDTNGSQPGVIDGTINISIRGVNSFSNAAKNSNGVSIVNMPLVVIDGIVGNLSDLDVTAIETITILKDPASAAIYGARAGNGVILITTKSGKIGDKLLVGYSGKLLVHRPYMRPERIWNAPEYMRTYNKALINGGDTDVTKQYTEEQIKDHETGDPTVYPSFNYEDAYIKNIVLTTHNLSFSGSSGKTTYYVNGLYRIEDGIIPGYKHEQLNTMVNLSSQVNKRVKLSTSVSLSRREINQPYVTVGDFILSLLSQSPTYLPYTLYDPTRYTFKRYDAQEAPNKNPASMVNEGGQTTLIRSLRAIATVDVNLMEGLTWTTKGSYYFNQQKYKNIVPLVKIYYYDAPDRTSIIQNGQAFNTITSKYDNKDDYSLYSTLTYTKSIDKSHDINALVGVSEESVFSTFIEAFREGIPNLDLDGLNAGPVENWRNNGGITGEYRQRSLFGRLQYNYKSKYLFETNGRVDGSSRFPDANKYGFFPSVSAGWRISEESFFKDNVEWVNNLKFRTSWGQFGNSAIGDYPYQSVYNTGVNYPFTSTVVSGISKTVLTNDEIKWETTTSTGFAVDAFFLQDMFGLTFEYFDKRTEGILRRTQLPGYVGQTPPLVNEGVVSNVGYELLLSHDNTIGEISYGVNANFSTYKNKLVDFGEEQISGFRRNKDGEEFNRYFMYVSDGIFKTQADIDAAPEQIYDKADLTLGDIRLKDVSGPEGVPDGKITPDDRVSMDGAHPSFTWGSSMYVSWKGFKLSALFYGVEGLKRFVRGRGVSPFTNHIAPLTYWRNAWSEENPNSDIPLLRLTSKANQTYNVFSSWWLKDISYIRCRNLALSYTLPNKLIKNYGITKVIVTTSIQNVFTITPYEFGDPENNNLTNYPSLQTFGFGLDVQF